MDTFDSGARLEIPISEIEHFSCCARQRALIHIEQVFEENGVVAADLRIG